MNRLEQDAADALEAYEQQQEWRRRASDDWQRSQQPTPTQVWTPTITEQERAEREQQIKAGSLPF